MRNPVLPGFHPDPSICRVGEDYYLANSTFQWWPGIRLSHSRDLVHWTPIGYALNRPSQLNLQGVDDSMGLWAPTLRYYDGTFFLVVTLVCQYQHGGRTQMSQENLLFTAEDIRGPWSAPVYLHDLGIDPDLFQDTDGCLYIVCQDTKSGGGPRPERISVQEYDPKQKRVIGPVTPIWDGTELGTTEGPHIYHRDGWYYLVTAEGGTFYGHAVSLCRSRNLLGPYETAPDNPILTMVGRDEVLARSGHADLVQTQNGAWWMVCLGGRPNAHRRCILGRETFLLPVRWTEDGWLEVNGGRGLEEEVANPDLPQDGTEFSPMNGDDDFIATADEWQFVREMQPEHLHWDAGEVALRARPQPLDDLGAVNVMGRRQRHTSFQAEVTVDFEADTDSARAGLACYYDRKHYIALALGRNVLELTGRDGETVGTVTAPWDGSKVQFRVLCEDGVYTFQARQHEGWVTVGTPQDGNHMSDEGAGVVYPWAAFTGAFVCLFATGNGARSDRWARFRGFSYRAR